MTDPLGPTCGPCCDELIRRKQGTRRHFYVMRVAAYEAAEVVEGEVPPRERAWADTYKSKYNPHLASERVGYYIRKPGSGSYRETEAEVAKISYQCYRQHLRPATQELADRKADIEEQVFDRITEIALCDIGDFFYDSDGTDHLLRLVRMIINGVRRGGSPGIEGHDLFDAGVSVSYPAGYGPPDKDRLTNVARQVGDWRIITVAEAREKGLTRYISEFRNDKGKIVLKIDSAKMRALYAGWLGKLSTTIRIPQAEAAMDAVETAFADALELRAPEAKRDVQAAALWLIGDRAQLNPGDPSSAKRDDETLEWTGSKWIVVRSGLRLVKPA